MNPTATNDLLRLVAWNKEFSLLSTSTVAILAQEGYESTPVAEISTAVQVDIAVRSLSAAVVFDLASMDDTLDKTPRTEMVHKPPVSNKLSFVLSGNRLLLSEQGMSFQLQRVLRDLDGTHTVKIVLSSSIRYAEAFVGEILCMIPRSTKCILVAFLSSAHEGFEEQNLTSCIEALAKLPHLQIGLEALVVGQNMLKRTSTLRLAELARLLLPLFTSLKVVEMTSTKESSVFDMQMAGKMWAETAYLHPSLQYIKCSHGDNGFWMPVVLLTGAAPEGWTAAVDVDWMPLDLHVTNASRETSADIEATFVRRSRDSAKLLTALEITLTAHLLVMNTWVSAVNCHLLDTTEREGIKRSIDTILTDLQTKTTTPTGTVFDWEGKDSSKLQRAHSQEMQPTDCRNLLSILMSCFAMTNDAFTSEDGNGADDDGNKSPVFHLF